MLRGIHACDLGATDTLHALQRHPSAGVVLGTTASPLQSRLIAFVSALGLNGKLSFCQWKDEPSVRKTFSGTSLDIPAPGSDQIGWRTQLYTWNSGYSFPSTIAKSTVDVYLEISRSKMHVQTQDVRQLPRGSRFHMRKRYRHQLASLNYR